jgi:hypothetical protein
MTADDLPSDATLEECAEMGALLLTERLAERGVLPLDEAAAIIKATITSFLVLGGRAPSDAAPNPN